MMPHKGKFPIYCLFKTTHRHLISKYGELTEESKHKYSVIMFLVS
jgi:hypothetical protein